LEILLLFALETIHSLGKEGKREGKGGKKERKKEEGNEMKLLF
jgi:hypothetical protein